VSRALTGNAYALRHPLLPALVALGFCFGTSVAFAQTPARTLQGFADTGRGLELTTSDGKYLIKPYSDGIVETTFIPQGLDEDTASHAVVMQPLAVAAKLTDGDGEL
jgi:oligosaccharide 4-alpha-D-glucosyltransferase